MNEHSGKQAGFSSVEESEIKQIKSMIKDGVSQEELEKTFGKDLVQKSMIDQKNAGTNAGVFSRKQTQSTSIVEKKNGAFLADHLHDALQEIRKIAAAEVEKEIKNNPVDVVVRAMVEELKGHYSELRRSGKSTDKFPVVVRNCFDKLVEKYGLSISYSKKTSWNEFLELTFLKHDRRGTLTKALVAKCVKKNSDKTA